MNTPDFQSIVLQHLGEQKSEHEEISRRLACLETQVKMTNGSVTELKIWKSNLMGQIGVITAIFSFVITAVWQFVKDKLTK